MKNYDDIPEGTFQKRLAKLMIDEGFWERGGRGRFAELVGISPSFLTEVLYNNKGIGQENILKIHKAFPNYSLDYLLKGEIPTQQTATTAPPRHQDDDDDCRRQLDIANAKLEMLQQCYDKLLDRVTPNHNTTQQQQQETQAPRGHDTAKDRRIGTHSGH